MKKAQLREQIYLLQTKVGDSEANAGLLRAEIRQLKTEIDNMRKNWRPVPMAHEWQARNPQCALCDDPRDAQRHHVTAESLDT